MTSLFHPRPLITLQSGCPDEGNADTAARRYSTILFFSPADSTVALPLATLRHCLSSGQMPLCDMP